MYELLILQMYFISNFIRFICNNLYIICVLFIYTNQGVIIGMEEKSFGKKILIIAITILIFFMLSPKEFI